MAKNIFSVPIFFIVFRETLEAAIIVSVLLGLAEQIIQDDGATSRVGRTTSDSDSNSKDAAPSGSPVITSAVEAVDDVAHRRMLVRKLRIQVRWATSSAD